MQSDHLNVNAVIRISATALQAVVEQSKKMARKDANGLYRVDTADCLGEMVSRFLEEKGFDLYVQDPRNYGSL